MEKRVTLADIARSAGVHATTVSLALRNHPRLPEETRLRLQSLAREMHYAPDPWVRALVAYRTRTSKSRQPATIAYVTNWNTRWGWKQVTAHPEFFRGAETRAQELGFQLEHFWLREPGLTHSRLSHILDARGIRGVILASHVREFDDAVGFDWSRFAGVKIDYFPHGQNLPVVTNNHLQIIRTAMQRIIAKGYRRIAFVMDDGWDITVDRLWSAGFSWEQRALPEEVRLAPYMIPQREPLTEWLRRTRPQVVVSKSDFVLPALGALGWRIPRDIAFVDLFLGESVDGVAGIRQNHSTVGALTIELLAGQLQQNRFGHLDVSTVTLVEGSWSDGASLPPVVASC